MAASSHRPPADSQALERRLHRLGLGGDAEGWADRYVLCEHVLEPGAARARQRFEAIARFSRDLIAHRWVKTRETREAADPKRVYYLSMEFLIGRMLRQNVMNMAADALIDRALAREGWDATDILEAEPDAGLGNGGLGRLAACFLESMATQQYSAMGYGLRYEYGIFRQTICNGYQIEQPDNWLRRPDPWEIARPSKVYPVKLHASFELNGAAIRVVPNRPSTLLGIAYDRPVIGYGARCVNTLRLWSAVAPEHFDLAGFSHGDFVGAVLNDVAAASLTRVLYPDDSTQAGRALRFLQQYFLVSCSLQDILARFVKGGRPWSELPNHAAIQLNDTHPALAVAELMRVLLDDAGLGWDEAWDDTVRTLAYTNHTLLPEALEQWPVDLFEQIIPRHLEIIYEINRRFLDTVSRTHPHDHDLRRRVSLIEEGSPRTVRMAHLAVVGTHSTNGVAAIHSHLLKTIVLPDFARLFPERFNNKTNGVTARRWLLVANPWLSSVITDAIGDGWITDLDQLRHLAPLAGDAGFQAKFLAAKRQAKTSFADWLQRTTGTTLEPESIFDCQIKRIHEYKRQLLNVLHIVMLYNRLRSQPASGEPPQTFLFAGKAAPAYHLAKRLIKLIHDVGARIDEEPSTAGRLRVLFLPDYNVSLAERLIPASDVSEQISTAGFEASGTGNMKFMMNGALTIGTRDGATIEMADAVGDDHIFLFGLTADEVASSRGWYNPRWHYEHDVDIREAVDLIARDHFSPRDPGIYRPIVDALLAQGDYYMHLADLRSYADTHRQVVARYRDRAVWAASAIRNVAASGPFSSDRTIAEYASGIWDVQPCPVP